MKYSELKAIKTFCDGLFSAPDWREVFDNIYDKEPDFEVNNVRFIDSEFIDQIQQDELSDDEYMLGSFNSWFLADVLGIDEDVILAMKKAEAYEAIGKLILSMGKLEELQKKYAAADGYGHHFNNWNGDQEEIIIGKSHYYVFDNH